MAAIRKPFEGVYNIVRFNWHFYLISVTIVLVSYVFSNSLPKPYHVIAAISSAIMLCSIISSLIISYYIYDLSGLYELNWLNGLNIPPTAQLVNIHAGFDETSKLLHQRYPDSPLVVFDFYDPLKHTEISIKRARKAYAPFFKTITIQTSAIPLPCNRADYIFLIFSAHEIRNAKERNLFFAEIKRVLTPGGKIVLLEHLRDTPNLLAYTIGVFHFLAQPVWQQTFNDTGLKVLDKKRINPFVTNYILTKDGSAD